LRGRNLRQERNDELKTWRQVSTGLGPQAYCEINIVKSLL